MNKKLNENSYRSGYLYGLNRKLNEIPSNDLFSALYNAMSKNMIFRIGYQKGIQDCIYSFILSNNGIPIKKQKQRIKSFKKLMKKNE